MPELTIDSIKQSVNGIIGPLAPLYDNKYQSTSLRYPRDLGSNPSRKHSIVFTVREADPAKLGEATSDFVTSLTDVTSGLSDSVRSRVGTITETFRDSPGRLLSELKNISGDIFKENLTAGQALSEATSSLSTALSKLNRKNGRTIGLYVPDTVNVSYSAGYDSDFSLSEALGKPYFLAQGAASLYNTFKDQGDLKMTNLVNAAGNDPFVRDFVATQIGRVTGTDLARIATAAGGYAVNPQLQVLFSGVGFREFQFDFIFTPYSREEAQTVESIIREFKLAAAPEIVSNGIFSQSLYMKIPDAFDIKFYYGNVENTKVHKIGESVLRNINVDYVGSGQWATFDDGSPMQIRMTLQFIETVIIDKNRIKQGY
jgi:hypothetical protein